MGVDAPTNAADGFEVEVESSSWRCHVADYCKKVDSGFKVVKERKTAEPA